MASDKINYPKLIDQAMQHIVKEALSITSKSSLPGNHHFFISFLTFHPKVVISQKLKKRYPEEMTIVLQYQFENLEVYDDYFSVSLSFDGVKEKLVIPYDALTAFADPSVKFGLQFKHLLDEELLDASEDELTQDSTNQKSKNLEDSSISNVVNLESFRNKH
jgi:hypothetical protein